MRFHADRIEKIALSTFLLGLAASWAGDRLSLPQLMGGGILLVALAPAAFGLRALVTGHIRIPIADKGRYEESYHGIGARASGLLLLLVAVGLALYGVLKVASLEGE